MAHQEILKKKKYFQELLSTGRLHDAMTALRCESEKKMTWEITDEINRTESAYRYMLKYAMDGVEDPRRHEIYDSIVGNLLGIYDRLERYVNTSGDPRLYYNVVRTSEGETPSGAIAKYRSRLATADAFNAAISGMSAGDSAVMLEAAERDLFNIVWTAYPLSDDDRTDLARLISDDTVPMHVKRLLVSALTLGNLMFLDESRLMILADTYCRSADERLALTALTGLLLSLFVNRDRHLSRAFTDRIAALKEEPLWKSDLKNVFLEFIRTRDTERITRKLRDEVVPEMLKIRPEISKKFNQIGPLSDPADIEENPEWQEMLEKSGLTEKMRELSEIQEEGGDVFMGTFAHLKSFPFFYDISNWFVPFHTDHSSVAKIGEGGDVIARLIAESPFFCEGDKYSFILAVGSSPKAQRDVMLSQLQAQNIYAAEIESASLNLVPDRRRVIINKYVQDLYRFFRLFRRKDDFTDPFAAEINLTAVPVLKNEFVDGETLRLVAEFYFKHKYYSEALDLFRLYETHTYPQAELYQKMGYCEQRHGNIDEALRYYQQAELLDARSAWTLRRIAACFRLKGEFMKAIDYYRRLDSQQPDRFATALALGECMAAEGLYADSIAQCFKAVYLDEKSPLPWHPLAWSLMMSGDYDRASEFYAKILGDNPTPADYLNIGHLNLLRHNSPEAVNAYKMSALNDPKGVENFINEIRKDAPALERAGLTPDIIPFVIDTVLYALD